MYQVEGKTVRQRMGMPSIAKQNLVDQNDIKQKVVKKYLLTILVLLAMTFAMTLVFKPVTAHAAKQKTTVTGVSSSYKKTIKESLYVTVKATPAYGRYATLQLYNKTTKKWVKVTRKKLKNTESASVKFGIPKKYRKAQTKTKWRVLLAANSKYKAGFTKTFTVTTVDQPVPEPVAKPSISARSFCVYDMESGKIIYSRNAKKQYACASTTKMLTALMILEKGGLDKAVTITNEVVNTGDANMNYRVGEQITVRNLLKAMLICSSNDSATALAQYHSGSNAAFARKMNARAKKLGCKNYKFVSPHGMPYPNNEASAYDLCLIQKAVYNKFKLYRQIIKTRSATIKNVSGTRTYYLNSTVAMNSEGWEGFQGGKTGYTDYAGHCFSGVEIINGHKYAFTIMGYSNSAQRWADARAIVQYLQKLK